MARDYDKFPDDENGHVLWQMYQDGDDLQDDHEIEFSILITRSKWYQYPMHVISNKSWMKFSTHDLSPVHVDDIQIIYIIATYVV